VRALFAENKVRFARAEHAAKCYCYAVACQQWTIHQNTNYADGQPNGATTIQTCQTACLDDRQCNGIDWVPRQQQGQQCWLSGPWSGRRGNTEGVTHYALDRNCRTGNSSESVRNFEQTASIVLISFPIPTVCNKYHVFIFSMLLLKL